MSNKILTPDQLCLAMNKGQGLTHREIERAYTALHAEYERLLKEKVLDDLSFDSANSDRARLLVENERLLMVKEAAIWLMHCHHDIRREDGKSGVSNDEWNAALTSVTDALRAYEQEQEEK